MCCPANRFCCCNALVCSPSLDRERVEFCGHPVSVRICDRCLLPLNPNDQRSERQPWSEPTPAPTPFPDDFCTCGVRADLNVVAASVDDGFLVVDRLCFACDRLYDESTPKSAGVSGKPIGWCHLRAAERLEWLCDSPVIHNWVKVQARGCWAKDALGACHDAEILACLLSQRADELLESYRNRPDRKCTGCGQDVGADHCSYYCSACLGE